MRETALHEWHVARGGRMVDFAGWHMPIQFTSIVEEHHAVRQQCGAFDIAHMGRLWFQGATAIDWLDRILTNHVGKMQPGQVRYSLVCDEAGGILDDVLITRFEESCLLVVNGANREKIVDWLGRHPANGDAEMNDRTTETFMFALQGPLAESILQPHVDVDLSQMRYYHARQGRILDHEAVISRTGYTGEDGFEVIVDNEVAITVWSQIVEPTAGETVTPCGLGCRDTLRLEAGMPLYGHELDESIDPITAGLKFAVKFDKPPFIGMDALEKIARQTDRRQRVGLELGSKRIARQGAKLVSGDNEIGEVTSGSFSPTLQKSIAMGYVASEQAATGNQLEVDIRGRREPATLVALPFYQRQRS